MTMAASECGPTCSRPALRFASTIGGSGRRRRWEPWRSIGQGGHRHKVRNSLTFEGGLGLLLDKKDHVFGIGAEGADAEGAGLQPDVPFLSAERWRGVPPLRQRPDDMRTARVAEERLVSITGRVEAMSGARRELCQALLQWGEEVRRSGNGTAYLSEDLECAHVFWLIAGWPNQEAFEHHARGAAFGRLIGAIELLASSDALTVCIGGTTQPHFRDVRQTATSALRPPAAGRTRTD
jgi:quinol monooxygenase YgiN